MRIRKKRKMIFSMVYQAFLVCIVLLNIVAIAAIAYLCYNYVIEEKGASRIDVLRQINDSNNVNRTYMENVMNMLYTDFSDSLITDKRDAVVIQSQLDQTETLLQSMGMNYTIDIIMNDRQIFSTSNESERNLEMLMNTYWYIKHYSGESESSWNLRFLDATDISSFGLSYGKTIFDENGKSCGVIVLTSAQQTLFRTFQQLLEEGTVVYILDRNGIVIAHTNPQRIGTWQADIKNFQEKYGYNSFTITRKNGKNIMLSNYYDADSGWTFVEEQDVTALIHGGLALMRNSVLVVFLLSGIVSFFVYCKLKKLSTCFEEYIDRIREIDPERIQPLPSREDYEEFEVLTNAFNGMIGRTEQLILDIRRREREKQRTEYDFLQAQINPHFLNNTLLAVKSLLHMKQVERASRMMNELVELLHIPANPQIQFIPLAEELNLIENYISIMNCRTDKQVRFFTDIAEHYRKLSVPRFILQPIVGNAFFHGFAEKEEKCEIHIHAAMRGCAFCITISDNGEGILPERLKQLRNDELQREQEHHHGIGIRNVRQRLQIIYGGGSDVMISSTPGKGTMVTLKLDRYNEVSKQYENAEEAK